MASIGHLMPNHILWIPFLVFTLFAVVIRAGAMGDEACVSKATLGYAGDAY